MQFSMLNQENFLSRLETFYNKNWSQVSENVFFLFFLVPLSILTIARRGKGSGEPGCDIRTRRSILYRTDAGKTKSIFLLEFCFTCMLQNWMADWFATVEQRVDRLGLQSLTCVEWQRDSFGCELHHVYSETGG
jgi:hypothetical protein